MKSTYDKKVSRHDIKEGDAVMLWWPYFKKGVSRSLQPKWKGPFTVQALIGETNCTITSSDGTVKHVHLNQLKPVEKRRTPSAHVPPTPPTGNASNDSVIDLQDLSDESDYESANESFEDAINGEEENNDRWCGVSGSNVMEFRTRSGFNGGGG